LTTYDQPIEHEAQPADLVGALFLVTALHSDEMETAHGLKRFVDTEVDVVADVDLPGTREVRWWQTDPVRQLKDRVGSDRKLLVRLVRDGQKYRFQPATEADRKLADAWLAEHQEEAPF
jgi:hypothetical protein